MAIIAELTTYRAERLAQAFWTTYQRLSEYLLRVHCGAVGLVYTESGEEVLVDLAACLTVAQSPPWLDVTAPVLDKLRTVDDGAYTFLCGAVGAYFQSWELRQDLGSRAETSFAHLRAVLADVAGDRA
jgi:hypothetical protein